MDSRPQPLLTAASIQAAVGAVIALLVAFGLKLTAEQTAAVLGVFAVFGPIATALLTRGKVTPVSDPVDNSGRALFPAASRPPFGD